MSNFGLKISLPGHDVTTATPEQCSIHSSYPPPKAKLGQSSPHVAKLYVDFTATVTQAVTHTLYRIPHGYGYIPFTLSNIYFDNGINPVIGTGYAGVGANLAINAYCDATYYYVTIYDDFFWTNSSSYLEVSYFIFAENGT